MYSSESLPSGGGEVSSSDGGDSAESPEGLFLRGLKISDMRLFDDCLDQ
jgi:hypothetical protein